MLPGVFFWATISNVEVTEPPVGGVTEDGEKVATKLGSEGENDPARVTGLLKTPNAFTVTRISALAPCTKLALVMDCESLVNERVKSRG